MRINKCIHTIIILSNHTRSCWQQCNYNCFVPVVQAKLYLAESQGHNIQRCFFPQDSRVNCWSSIIVGLQTAARKAILKYWTPANRHIKVSNFTACIILVCLHKRGFKESFFIVIIIICVGASHLSQRYNWKYYNERKQVLQTYIIMFITVRCNISVRALWLILKYWEVLVVIYIGVILWTK